MQKLREIDVHNLRLWVLSSGLFFNWHEYA